MSLRSVGSQLLQTAPSLLLAGASTASLSLWVRVNPGSNVASPGGVNIFGDAGAKVSATLSGSGSLRLGWSSNDGTTNHRSACNLTLTPGTSYHIAATWQAGSQRYFVDGVEIGSDNQPGPLGVLGDAAPHAFRLGSDSAGTDVTLDEPTLWVGYALSPQDVRNLRDRLVSPSGIAPGSIALEWSLAGPDGVAARVGDAGLADGSATGLSLSSVVGAAPTYQAGVLSYAPAARIGTATVGPSGQSIIVVVEDGAGSPAGVKSLKSTDNVQSLNLSGMPAGGGFALSFGGQTTAPIAVTALAPLVYGTWHLSVTAGNPQQIANTTPAFGWEATAQLFEVFDSDGTTLLGSTTVDLTHPPSYFTDGSTNPDGNLTRWTPIGTFTPTGSTMTVRISAPAGQTIIADGLRVGDSVTSVVQHLDDAVTADFTGVGFGQEANSSDYHWYGQSNSQGTGSGAGPRYMADPSAIQAALLALSSVQAGGVAVSAADSHGSGPYTIEFVGPMGGASQPAITASDPAVAVATTTVGGVYPTIRINGGGPIPLKSPVWGAAAATGTAPYLPYVAWMLPQSAPASQMLGSNWGQFTTVGANYPEAAGYNLPALRLFGPGASATYLFPHQPPGTYRVSVTWPVAAALSTSVVLTARDGANNVLATATVDQTASPGDFSADGAEWAVIGSFTLASYSDVNVTVSVAAGQALADTVRLDRTSPDASVRIGPGDVVTLDLVAGWASTAAGPVEGATALPLANLAGGTSLPARPAGPQAMKIGYNALGSSYTGFCLVHANVAKGMGFSTAHATDGHGYPTVLTGQTQHFDIFQVSNDLGGKGKGLPVYPFGQYTVIWDGACDLGLIDGSSLYQIGNYAAGTAVSPISSSLTGTTGNRRVYNVTANPLQTHYGPIFSLIVHGTTPDPSDPSGARYLTDVQNLRIFPPGVDPDNPPLFHPSYVAKLRGVQGVRFMDALVTNNGNIADFADYYTAADAGYGDPKRMVDIPIAQINGYTGPATIGYAAYETVVLEVTTAVPHGLATGQFGIILNSTGTVQSSNGTYSDSFSPGEHNSNVQVLSPTTFLMGMHNDTTPGHTNRVMTNTLTGAECGRFHYEVGGGGIAFTDCVALCNQLEADPYINVPVWASDDCVTAMARSVAAGLAPGLKVRVEFGNECWNFGFQAFGVCCMNSVLVLGDTGGLNYKQWYVYRMKQVHDLFAAAMTAAGRGGDLIRVMGTQGGYSGITQYLVDYAVQYGARVDELAVAPYFENYSVFSSGEPALASTFDAMTVDQVLDVFELNALHGGVDGWVSSHRPILDAAGYTSTRVICYEGGPEYVLPAGTTVAYNQRTHAVIRHPRMYGVMLAYLQKLQAAGCSFYHDYNLNYYTGPPVYGAYYGWDMQPGTGDPTLDAVNISDPEALDRVKSEVGGAITAWAALSGGAISTPSKPKTLIPGRNGQLTTTGFPRGLSRPIR